MQSAAFPEIEEARIKALLQYGILDTEAEGVYDDFVLMASYICQTPIALISLIDPARQWFKAKTGLTAAETPRDISFCAHAILQPDVFVVPNALDDSRFADNPLVTGDPHIRFYAGAPLVTPGGLAIGTLCAIDRTPRTLSTEQISSLQALARQVVAQLELRRITKELKLLVDNKNKLFHILSHDLRSPFTGILGFSQILADEATALSTEEIQEYATLILTSSEQLLQLVDNMLKCARFELGSFDYQPVLLNMDEAAGKVLALLKSNAARKNITLLYKNDSTVQLEADPTMLHTVLQNLIGNAIKFTAENGRVTLRATDQDTMIHLSVTDSGVGIAPDKLLHLFEFMAGRSTSGTAGEKGTGLGLLLCREFVEKHGGRIWAESEPGCGSSFHVLLPGANNR
jgi:signal transduction histidine kinase